MRFNTSYVNSKPRNVKPKVSNKRILLEWLHSKMHIPFGNHEIQTNVITYALNMYDHKVTPDTVSRLWRSLREDYKLDKSNSDIYNRGLTVQEVPQMNSKQKYFLVESI